MRRTLLLVTLLLGVSLGGTSLTAQSGFSFSVAMGYTGVSGDWGDILKDGIDADINISYLWRHLRFGAGAYYVSYDLEPPLEEESVSNVSLHASLGYVFLTGRVRPYLQLRGVYQRLRPEGEAFHPDPPPLGEEPEEEEGENPAPRRNGTGGTLVGGVEIVLTPNITLDPNAW
ncbi:MAG: hypothetical protein GTO22_20415, partial [Gemmatimonadales bacterium]|nr:hypothetical protein [Gemmatimonadales bacterium]